MDEKVSEAAAALSLGHLVAFPTETVFGLGADACNEKAVEKIFIAKGRPKDHPLIVHISSAELMGKWATNIPDYAFKLANDFWPGPMTLVLSKSDIASDLLTGGQSTIGLRVPSHPVAQELLREFERIGGLGVAAPSANRFGKVSPTTAQAVRAEIDQYLEPGDIVLEGSQSEVGIESTIIDCTTSQPRILRLGAVTASMITHSAGLDLVDSGVSIRVSGSLESHYSPNATLLLDVKPNAGDGLLALDNFPTPDGVIRLASPVTTEEYANQLYAALRRADELGLVRVVALTPSGDELSEAILDRLRRASKKSEAIGES
jgi:L-threonylcarbamoyladenylate synthase